MHPYRNEAFGPCAAPAAATTARGNVKFAILELLKEKPRHGYDIIREMEERSGGVYSPSPGVIYPTLQALEDQDYVKSLEQDGKKIYSITESGIPYLQGHQEREGHAHGRGRHGEGFRPPFRPRSRSGPGAAMPAEAGSRGRRRHAAAGGEAEGGGERRRDRRGRGSRPRPTAGRRGLGPLVRLERRPRAHARDALDVQRLRERASSGRSATRRSSRRSARCSAKPRPRSTTSYCARVSCFRVDATLQSETQGLETRAAHLSR